MNEGRNVKNISKITMVLLAGSAFGASTSAYAQSAPVVTPPAHQEAEDQYGVNRMTGRYSMQPHVLVRAGGDSGLALAYTDSGGSSLVHNFFFNMVWGQDQYQNTTVTVQFGQVSETFRQGPGNTFTSEYPTGSTLEALPSSYLYITRDGTQYYFEGSQTRTVYPDGREVIASGMVQAEYNGGLVPTAVTANTGYMLKFAYSGTTVQVQALNLAQDYCNPASTGLCSGVSNQRTGQVVRTGSLYVEQANVTYALTDAAGATTTYRLQPLGALVTWIRCTGGGSQVICSSPSYQTRLYMMGITLPGRSSEDIVIGYGSPTWQAHEDIRINTLTIGGVAVNYNVYNEFMNVPPEASQHPYIVHAKASINGEELYHLATLDYDGGFGGSRREILYQLDTLNRPTVYGHNAARDLSSATYPEQNAVGADYDARNNIIRTWQSPKPSSGTSATQTLITYASSCSPTTRATCNLPATITDPGGGVTDYTYNGRGQVLTITQPAPTAGAPRPKITNTYTDRTAYVRNSSGAPVAAGAPISLLTRTQTCRTQSTCAGTTDEITTDYDYGPTSGFNNLRLRGVAVTAVNSSGAMETLRTCYTYNAFGERVSETAPAANLASCS